MIGWRLVKRRSTNENKLEREREREIGVGKILSYKWSRINIR